MVDFSALYSAWGWQGESRADKLKAVEALKIWLGSNPSSRRVATSALCAALTDDLKLITLSQSKTFLSFDTTRQMACASVISATITESTAASLISFTADTLKSKAIDKAAGAEREVVGLSKGKGGENLNNLVRDGGNDASDAKGCGAYGIGAKQITIDIPITAPATEAARQWQGWGTAMKPSLEPITVARKPLVGTVAANVLEHGTGALNIDGCRVGDFQNTTPSCVDRRNAKLAEMGYRPGEYQMGAKTPDTPAGRWPANLIHDGSEEVVAGFPAKAGASAPVKGTEASRASVGRVTGERERVPGAFHADTGSAARFFYCAKASRADRNEGLPSGEAPAVATSATMREREDADWPARNGNHHPTVKPTDLMAYLCRLVTPPGGVVLDPFMGSGSTGKAAIREGFRFIGCELSEEYLAIARARIEHEVRSLDLAAATAHVCAHDAQADMFAGAGHV